MPTYEYECETCGHEFEIFQSMNDRRLSRCPKDVCPAKQAAAKGKGKVRRLLGTGAGVIFKGSGFYETDYRSKSYNDGHKQEKKSAKTAESGAAKSKEDGGKAKPEAKPSSPAGGS